MNIFILTSLFYQNIGKLQIDNQLEIKSLTNLSTNELIKHRVRSASILLKNNEGNVSEVMYKVPKLLLKMF